jgi:alpha/beta superfamily hydrolase
VDKLNTQKNVTVDYRIFAGADHVFAHHAEQVGDALEDYVTKVQTRKTMALAAD